MSWIYLGRFMNTAVIQLSQTVISHPWQITQQSRHSGGTPVVRLRDFQCARSTHALGPWQVTQGCKLVVGTSYYDEIAGKSRTQTTILFSVKFRLVSWQFLFDFRLRGLIKDHRFRGRMKPDFLQDSWWMSRNRGHDSVSTTISRLWWRICSRFRWPISHTTQTRKPRTTKNNTANENCQKKKRNVMSFNELVRLVGTNALFPFL